MRRSANQPRVLVGGFWHETNTFSSVPTDAAAISACVDLAGPAMLEVLTGTNTEIGGMIAVAARLGFELVPLRFAGAFPSAPVTADLFETILADLADRARAAGPADGVLLALHGAMVAEGVDEADRAIVERLRAVIGPGVPVVCTFDLHANLTAGLVAAADMLVGYRTNPHLDMAARGEEAAEHLARLMRGERLHAGFRKLPMVSVSQTQVDRDEPMRGVLAAWEAVLAAPDVAAASVAVGYPYADIPNLGMSVLVYAHTPAAAAAAADSLARVLWDRRDAFVARVEAPEVAVAQALAEPRGRGPVILVDVADNIGGGSPGDGTVLLAALLAARAPSAAVVLTDPEAAGAAAAAGLGGRFRGVVGGKTDALHGPPVEIDGIVRFAAPVAYRRDEVWMTGQTADQGLTVRADAGGVAVVLTERRVLPYDTRHLRAVGIAPESIGILVVKAAAGWRTPFEEMMARAIYCDTPGVNAPNLAQFSFRRRPRPLYPLEPEAAWSPPQ